MLASWRRHTYIHTHAQQRCLSHSQQVARKDNKECVEIWSICIKSLLKKIFDNFVCLKQTLVIEQEFGVRLEQVYILYGSVLKFQAPAMNSYREKCDTFLLRTDTQKGKQYTSINGIKSTMKSKRGIKLQEIYIKRILVCLSAY